MTSEVTAMSVATACDADGWLRDAHARGMCRSHYMCWYRSNGGAPAGSAERRHPGSAASRVVDLLDILGPVCVATLCDEMADRFGTTADTTERAIYRLLRRGTIRRTRYGRLEVGPQG